MPPPEGLSAPDPELTTAPAGRAPFRHTGDVVRAEGRRITLVEGSFTAPDGTAFTRDIVRHPGAVVVVPVTEGGTVLLVRQYRGAVDRELLELPAGTRDVEGEAPETTARRELEEEVGVRAGQVVPLLTVFNSPGFCDEETFIFLARDLSPGTPARHGEEERFLEVVELAFDDIDTLMARGALTDAQTVLGLALARPHLPRAAS